jgi:serine/threonine protein phosphatase PrpC
VNSKDEMKRKKVMKPGSNSIDYGVFSDIGQRQQNQDAVKVTSGPVSLSGKGRLFAVADGMGGHLGGSLASRSACKGLNDYYEKELNEKGIIESIEISRHLGEVILRIDRDLRRQGLRDRTLEDMGTTLSCLVVAGTHSIIAHVGDSRIYRLRNGHLTCLTVDHTFVQDMIYEGEVDPQKAHLHPLRHMLTRAVGTGEPLELVDTRIDELKKKDCFLLCTDGLYNVLTASCILDLLSRHVIAFETAQALVTQALNNGARDNTTAVVIRVE